MALLGSLATLRAQTARLEIFATTFTYLDEMSRAGSPAATRLASAAMGTTVKIELSGGAFALEQVYQTKARPDGFFESHRKYIDMQVVVTGEEVLELVEISRLAVSMAYDAERDLIKYADYETPSLLRLNAGEAAIFFPVDGHMPGLRPDGVAGLVRKTVIKVPVPA